MVETLLVGVILCLLACIVLLALLLRRGGVDLSPIGHRLDAIERTQESAATTFRDELGRGRAESAETARLLRDEVSASAKGTLDSLLRGLSGIGEQQGNRLDGFAVQLATASDDSRKSAVLLREEVVKSTQLWTDASLTQMQQSTNVQQNQLGTFKEQLTAFSVSSGQQQALLKESVSKRLEGIQELVEKRLSDIREEGRIASLAARAEITKALKDYQESLQRQVAETASGQRTQMGDFLNRLNDVANGIDKRMETLRSVVEQKLKELQDDNTKKLDQMRHTVDEKLQGTLERRLGDSFKLVSDRLELVHKGLGEMHTLASGVGDLKRVLTNVKTRGTWGEVQLGNLLEQMLTRDQYEQNVAANPASGERVEYAIRLPGRTGDINAPVYLPIDSKCPQADYHRLVEASERGDADAVKESVKQLDIQIRGCGRDISQKYVSPPNTTDFAILFVPTEGLFSEVLRCPGLTDYLQRECRVMVAGPTTLAALLNSLQMGFRTLAIEQRSSEVWSVLSAVKTEFGKFGAVFEKVRRKLGEASNTIDDAAVRTRAMERKLRTVDELPAPDAANLLGLVRPTPESDHTTNEED